MAKDSRIEYLVYKTGWDPTARRPIQELHAQPRKYVTVDSFKKSEKESYFCPTCGFPGTRWPIKGEFSKNDIPARLVHTSAFPQKKCPCKTERKLGEFYASGALKQKAVENETLIVIDSWSDGPQGGPLDKPGSYSGVVDNPNSPIFGGTIPQYVGDSYSRTSESQSLTRIAQHLDMFLTRSLKLPDSETQHIYDLLHHVSQIPSNPNSYPMLFWGRAKYMVFGEQFLIINFPFPNYEIAFFIPRDIVQQHGWDRDYLLGKPLMICGEIVENDAPQKYVLEKYQKNYRWRVRIEHWGQIALISPKNATLILEKFQEHWNSFPDSETLAPNENLKEADDDRRKQREGGTDRPGIQPGAQNEDLGGGNEGAGERDRWTGRGSIGAERNRTGVPEFIPEATRKLSENTRLLGESIESDNQRRQDYRKQLRESIESDNRKHRAYRQRLRGASQLLKDLAG